MPIRVCALALATVVLAADWHPVMAQANEDAMNSDYFIVENPLPEPPIAQTADVESIDAILTALYDVISGPPGRRNWERFRSLFVPDARLIPTGPGGNNGYDARGVEGYVRSANSFFMQNGFFETEIARKIERYGNIAHVFSTYESRREPEAEPFDRGINSIQLFFDGHRWWVMTIMWQAESAGVPLPAEYLSE